MVTRMYLRIDIKSAEQAHELEGSLASQRTAYDRLAASHDRLQSKYSAAQKQATSTLGALTSKASLSVPATHVCLTPSKTA